MLVDKIHWTRFDSRAEIPRTPLTLPSVSTRACSANWVACEQWVVDAGSPEHLEKIVVAVNDAISHAHGEIADAADVSLGAVGF